jgi:hypothetical protein
MKSAVLVLSLLFFSASAAAQWKSDDKNASDTPDRKSVNGFGAHLVVVKDPQVFIQEWLKPQMPKFDSAKKTKAGESLGIIVLFAGCKEASGACDSDVDYTIYKPDGSVFAQRLKQPLWKEPAPPRPNIQLGRAILAFRFPNRAVPGKYKITAQVRDSNANTTIDLVTEIEVKD